MSGHPWRQVAPGTRVVLRRRRDDSPAPHEPPLTDLLGEVVAVDDDGITVRTRTGDVRVPAGDVVRCKPVPPPPAPRVRR